MFVTGIREARKGRGCAMTQPWAPFEGPSTVIKLIPNGINKLTTWIIKKVPAELTIGAQGIAYRHMSTQFRIVWPELRQIRLRVAHERKGGDGLGYTLKSPLGAELAFKTMDRWRIGFVSLIMDAADPATFAQQHVELGEVLGEWGAQGPGSYGVLLGAVTDLVQQIGQELAACAGTAYGGAFDEGLVPFTTADVNLAWRAQADLQYWAERLKGGAASAPDAGMPGAV